ncbi:MAG TPA: PQQ-binding-like beta-propeller repeat protein, partial [Planctomycetota bacterium]|nr:PQQ-binding-like beta-propeller repeat protein [Planctomycetota bacterium]
GKWRNEHFFWFNARIVDPPGTPYVDRNIVWTAPLYDRSIATPIVVGDRIFVLAEPDQILCLDKATGRQLWTNFLTRYHATPKAERDANPAFREKLDPLVAKLPEMKTLEDRMGLRKQIDAALVAIDKEKYQLVWDGHMEGHFRVVGWTMPTPVSDGEHVWVWCGNGIAACYDMDGHTRWIRRVNPGKLHYPASPALIDGKFIVYAGGGFNMVALDAATGAEAWRQPKVDRTQASLIPARINGVSVVISQQADVVRVADGKILYELPNKPKGAWTTSVCLNNVIYQPSYNAHLTVLDFNKGQTTGDAWQCNPTRVDAGVVSKNSKGTWVDRATCGSPLIHEGIYYNIDVFGTLYAADLQTRKPIYREELSSTFNMLSHYNAVPVAASVTLGGKHLYAMDNQGTCVVFEPGREFKKVAVNRIETTARRLWPMRPQEEIGYSPPVFDGSRMYLRGEQYLYCIGK